MAYSADLRSFFYNVYGFFSSVSTNFCQSPMRRCHLTCKLLYLVLLVEVC